MYGKDNIANNSGGPVIPFGLSFNDLMSDTPCLGFPFPLFGGSLKSQ